MNNKIIVFTGSRGEWGYLRPILKIFSKKKINFKIFVSNMHLLPDKGFSFREIERDGFKIAEKIYMNVSGPDDLSWPKSLGLLNLQLPDLFKKYSADIILLAGDRAETFIASVSAYYADIPIAHIQAGELSGHKDGMVRHAIGKLAHLHFASNYDAVKRLRRFGEQNFRIHQVGAPQLDDIKKSELLKISQIKKMLSVEISKKFALCIVHPTSEDIEECVSYVELINTACSKNNLQQVWIYPNNDSGSIKVINAIDKINFNFNLAFRNLNRKVYLSLLSNCEFIIGNSSSGILEAPSLKKATINLGVRQKNRVSAKSVIHIQKVNVKKIDTAINKIKLKSMKQILDKVKNPYGDGKSSERIVKILKNIDLNTKLRNKFVDEKDDF